MRDFADDGYYLDLEIDEEEPHKNEDLYISFRQFDSVVNNWSTMVQ